jgi:hypothetical protein
MCRPGRNHEDTKRDQTEDGERRRNTALQSAPERNAARYYQRHRKTIKLAMMLNISMKTARAIATQPERNYQ